MPVKGSNSTRQMKDDTPEGVGQQSHGTSLATGKNRVSTQEVARAIDAILVCLRIDHPTALYKYLRGRVGVNATTLMRYHRMSFDTAPRRVLELIETVRREVVRGDRLPLGVRAWRRRGRPPCTAARDRVPASKVKALFGKLRSALGIPGQVIVREAARELGMHHSTVFRLAGGRLATAPRALLAYLTEMQRRVGKGEVQVFHRAKSGVPVVARQAVKKAIDAILGRGLFPRKVDLFQLVETVTG